VQYYQTDFSLDFYTIDVLLEYVPGGSLKAILQKYHSLEVPIIRNFAKQLLVGLQYLHQNYIVHRDLKSANVLISTNGVVKLTDFGSSVKFEENDEYLSRSLKGSPYWMAPEVVLRQGHSFPADIWSFGCVLIEMVTGQPPWSNYSRETKEVLALIKKENSIPDIPATVEELREVIVKCVVRNPRARPDAEEILRMKFFSETIENE
jgi:mitogen-activated protein kinase kinase kinase ANP1